MTHRGILEKLDDIETAEGTLPPLLEFYRKLVQIQTRVGQELDTPNPGLTSEMINQRAEQGKPLLESGDLIIDPSLLSDTFREVATLFAEYSDLLNHTRQELKELPDVLLNQDSVNVWYEGMPLPDTKGLDEALLGELIHATVKPFLISYSKTLLDSVDQEHWRRGYCPICGGNPDFAYLDTERGARWLVCSRCDAEWLFQRLECPYCNSTNQNELSYYADDEGPYRLYVYDRCERYLKAIDLRKAEPGVLIPLERLLTLEIDAQGREYGYLPCGSVRNGP